ncbi:hypothetical protein [Kitasatospora purpeofusca]|uniref:hypothetical protein n=1 Tax=Kitasatospora purpeofusca TaxID=67352 RepID=UPI0036C206A0
MARYRSTYTGRYEAIGKLLRSPGAQRATIQAATRVMSIAQFMSPTGDPAEDRHPGLYRSSFVVVPITKNVRFKGRGRMRASARLMNTARHAVAVEYGNGKVQRYAVLRSALDAARISDG